MKKLTGLFFVILLALFFVFSGKKTRNAEQKAKVEIKETVFGCDFSHYQGNVNWDKIGAQTKHPIEFFLFRATMGDDRKDACFVRNFTEAKKRGFVTGGYHYFSPDEDPLLQIGNYTSRMDSFLRKGDFIPILDIEAEPDSISMDSLKKNLRVWLDTIERRYGVRPMLYTGHHFYKTYLAKDFSEYPLWIAAYSGNKRGDSIVNSAEIHQFTDKVKVPGIRGGIDGNDISRKVFDSLLIR